MDGQATTEEWLIAGATGSITLSELDNMIKDYYNKRKAHDEASEISKDLYKEAEEAKRRCLEAMRQSGKQKYSVDGIGTAWIVNELIVATPKTKDQKKQLFDFIGEHYGEDFLMEKLAIHHATLQTLYREAFKEACEKGEGEKFHIPGLDQPTSYSSLSFRKES